MKILHERLSHSVAYITHCSIKRGQLREGDRVVVEEEEAAGEGHKTFFLSNT